MGVVVGWEEAVLVQAGQQRTEEGPLHTQCVYTCAGLLQGQGDLGHLCALGAPEEEKRDNWEDMKCITVTNLLMCRVD